MEYKCIKEFLIEKYDEDCFPTGKCELVPVESVWCVEESNMIGGEIHLNCVSGANGFGWIELAEEDLNKYFESLI